MKHRTLKKQDRRRWRAGIIQSHQRRGTHNWATLLAVWAREQGWKWTGIEVVHLTGVRFLMNDEPSEPTRHSTSMEADDVLERVCDATPFCRCDATEAFSCNCFAGEDGRCTRCLELMIPVEEYEARHKAS